MYYWAKGVYIMTADMKLYILGFRKQINRKQANNIGNRRME